MTTLRYLRFKIFQTLLVPFSKYSRRKRGELFTAIMRPRPGEAVLDVGGQPEIWDYVNIPLQITCVNLPGTMSVEHRTHHSITYVEGDGCDMREFHPGQFDLVFSNSVIEHVGNYEKRTLFANEIRRLSHRYWVQTPYKYFPIEAHCGMPLWWLYPESARAFFLTRWSKKLPAWTEMVATTTVISKGELRELFPDSRIVLEWKVFPKSLIAYSTE